VKSALKNSQRQFYALLDAAGVTPTGRGDRPARFNLEAAEADGTPRCWGRPLPENETFYEGIAPGT
jgi:hypothetical protein